MTFYEQVRAFTTEVGTRVGPSIGPNFAVAGHMDLPALERFAIAGPALSIQPPPDARQSLAARFRFPNRRMLSSKR